MGRKKSSRAPAAGRKREVLPTTFDCLFCNHEKSVICKLDKKAGVGSLKCNVCGQKFQTPINALSHPVDIHADWIDACETVDKQAKANQSRSPSAGRTTSQARLGSPKNGPAAPKPKHRDDQYEEDFVENDEVGMEEDYAPGH